MSGSGRTGASGRTPGKPTGARRYFSRGSTGCCNGVAVRTVRFPKIRLRCRNPLTVGITLDNGRRVTAVVPTTGGTLETVTADGTRLVLTIPAGALVEETEITITPIAGITGSPISGGRLAGLHFEPEGLRFFQPVTLDIIPPGGNAAVDAVGFAYEGNGEQFHLHPVAIDPARITLTLFHFSGAGAYLGHPEFTPITILPPPISFVPVDWETRSSTGCRSCSGRNEKPHHEEKRGTRSSARSSRR